MNSSAVTSILYLTGGMVVETLGYKFLQTQTICQSNRNAYNEEQCHSSMIVPQLQVNRLTAAGQPLREPQRAALRRRSFVRQMMAPSRCTGLRLRLSLARESALFRLKKHKAPRRRPG